MKDTSVAQEVAKSSDNLNRFWLALCGACLVIGAWSANLTLNQNRIMANLESVSAVAADLAKAQTATAIQTQTYQAGQLRLEIQQDRNIDRMADMLNELLSRP